jgi:hypothetical protein
MVTLQPGQTMNPPITITYAPTSSTAVTQPLQITGTSPGTGTTTVTLRGSVRVVRVK